MVVRGTQSTMKPSISDIVNAKSLVIEKINKKMKKNMNGLEAFGRKVYSQTDEDGILEEILSRLKEDPQGIKFLEIGVGGGTENNTLKLLGEGGRGVWIEGDEKKFGQCKGLARRYIKEGRLSVIKCMVQKDNSKDILKHVQGLIGSCSELTVFSIDIDGPDYDVVEELLTTSDFRPKIIVAEYNGKLSPYYDGMEDYKIPKDDKIETRYMYGTGSSLKRWCKLLKEYRLVACGILGINAFYVRNDLACEKLFKPAEIGELFNEFDPVPWVAGAYTQMHGFPEKYSIYD